MSEPKLSIIIPTYNRREILLRTLEGYSRQTALGGILEVLVVDDGSTDGTGAAVVASRQASAIPIRYLREENKGLAAARNYGIREARGELLLFGDDDIIPGPTLVAEHIAWNHSHPEPTSAILGCVTWSPEMNPTPFMEWLGLEGVLFGFGHLFPGKEVPFDHSYFCNTSVKRNFLVERGMFDEEFRAYGFEDIELSYRLFNQGFRVLYNPKALGYHYKRMTYADVCRRAELVIAASELFESKEAGKYLKELRSRRGLLSTKRKIIRGLAKFIAPFVAPLTPVLDTQISLPKEVYRAIYHCLVVPRAQKKIESSKILRQYPNWA